MNPLKIEKSITRRDSTSLNLYLKDVAKTSPLSQEEEIELAKRIHQGDLEARDKLVTSNLRFVITVAKQYQGRGLDLEDLIAEGVCGMIHAAELFDETKGFKFISYAVWWIRQAISRAILYQNSSVRLPISQIEPINKLNKITAEFEQREGRKPALDELASLAGLSEEKVSDLLTSTNFSVSIDSPSIEDEDCTIADIIPNPNSSPTDLFIQQESLSNGIESILRRLSPREHDIICMVFGLNGIKEMGFEEIGRKFALTGERIRQIKEGLLQKFRTDYKDDFENL